jgi:Mce-associated membrane protein
MADDDKRPRKPVVGSRNPTGRPRKVAGRQPPAGPAETPGTPENPDSDVAPDLPTKPGKPKTQKAPKDPKQGSGMLGGPRTTLALVVAMVLLIGIGAFEVFYLTGDDDPAPSAQRPVVTGELSHRAAVEAAATSTAEILSTSYKNYDEQVDRATAQMTDTFAKEYEQTSDEIKDQFVANETQLQVEAVAQGVVRASADEVQALLFLNQYVQKKDHEGEPKTDYAQYRALVTVVHTNQGWLVSDIKTQ